MAEKRAITIWVNGKEIKNDITSINKEYLNLLKSQRKMTRGSEEYVAAGKKIRELKGHIDEHNKQLRETGGMWGKIQASANVTMLKYAAGAAAIGAAILGVVENNRKFEKSLSSLSALTGATGDELKYYSKAARDIGKSTTYGADEAVKAFALIGSAKPDLLANKEALVGVTREAIALAEAAEMDLPAAADSLTKVMNQFSLDSSQASRTINVLAAGAKEGAVAIPGISDAIVQFGAVAKTSNVSLEDSVTLIELLGEKGISGAEAGTKLRNVLITLAAGPKETNPQIVGLTKALENLKAKGMDTTEMTKLFGKENMVAGQILIENSGKVADFTKAITGTNEAYSQQKTNTDNLDGSVKRFENSVEALTLSFNGDGGLTKALRWVVDGFSSLVLMIAGANKSVREIKEEVAAGLFAQMVEEDKREMDKYGELFLKSIKLQMDNENNRIRTKTKNIDQLMLEKATMGKVISASIDMTNEDMKRARANVESLEKRLNLGKQYLELKKQTNKEDAKNGGGGLSDEYLKKEKELAKKLEDLRFAIEQMNRDAWMREIYEAERKYTELEKEAKGHAARLKEIEELKGKELNAINTKYAKEGAKEVVDSNEDLYEKLLTDLEKAQKDFDKEMEDLQKKSSEEIHDRLMESSEKDTSDYLDSQKEKLDGIKRQIEEATALAGGMASMFSAYDEYQTASENAKLEKEKHATDTEKARLDKRLQYKLISQAAYNQQVEALDADLAQKQKTIAIEQANRQKKIRAFETFVNTAAAVVKFLVDPGGAAGVALSIMAGATGALQIAAIQKAVPAYKDGGEVTKDSLIRAGEAGREVILSNKTLTNPTTGPISEWLFQKQKGMNPVFPGGAVVSPTTSIGSAASASGVGQIQPIQNNVTAVVPGMDALAAEMREIKQFLSDPKNRQAYISTDLQKKHNDEEKFRTGMKKLG